jgi:hypothetical protein
MDSSPPGFSSYRGYDKLLAERIHVHILGHAGRILRYYLHDLCDHDIQSCYYGGHGLRIKFLLRALFGCFRAWNHRVAFSTSRESLPMGVKHRVYYLVFATNDEVNFYSCIGADISIFIGCATSAPDGSSPRGYSWFFIWVQAHNFLLQSCSATYRSYFTFSSWFLHPFYFRINCSSGARTMLSMGVGPRL